MQKASTLTDVVDFNNTAQPPIYQQVTTRLESYLREKRIFVRYRNYYNGPGNYFRDWWRCYRENSVLEKIYPRFLVEQAGAVSGPLIEPLDAELARTVWNNPVVWTDSTKHYVGVHQQTGYNEIFKSRVKQIVVTSFGVSDLVFYCVLISVLLGYLWMVCPDSRIGNNKT